MNWRSKRVLVPLLIVCIILIIGIGVAVVYLRSSASTDITIVWQSTPATFTQQDRQDIQTAWKTALLAPNPNRLAGHEFTIIDAQRKSDWAIFDAVERVSHDVQPIATEPLFFIAHLQGSIWTIWIPSSTGFCSELKQVPDTLLNATDKSLFC